MAHKVKIFNIISVILLLSFSFVQVDAQDVGLRTVVIDPGHGGKDPGAPGPDSRNSEKHIVLNISKLLGANKGSIPFCKSGLHPYRRYFPEAY